MPRDKDIYDHIEERGREGGGLVGLGTMNWNGQSSVQNGVRNSGCGSNKCSCWVHGCVQWWTSGSSNANISNRGDAYVAPDGLLRHSIKWKCSFIPGMVGRVEVEPIFMQRSECYSRYSSLRKWIVWMGMFDKTNWMHRVPFGKRWNFVYCSVTVFSISLQCMRQVFFSRSYNCANISWKISQPFTIQYIFLALLCYMSSWPTVSGMWQEHVINSSCQATPVKEECEWGK